MSQWFYAEGNREQRGPLASENLVELFRSGRIALDTLVWREGSGDWQPLGNFVDELGLATVPGAVDEPVSSSGPPPLRPLPPASPPARTATAPPRSGLSGCALTAIIVASIGGVLIVVVAVLAAIAMPAYQQYVLRSKTAMVYAQLLPLKTEISAFVLEHERCPVNGDTGFGSPESYAQAGIREIRIGRFEAGHCGLEAWLDLPANAPLHGTAIWLDYDTQSLQWECSAEADDKYLPHECRG